MNAIIAILSILALSLSGCEGVTGGDKQADFSIATHWCCFWWVPVPLR